jgi:murein DD-endopeptidase MepM/ murein hydrolase activator NlpD
MLQAYCLELGSRVQAGFKVVIYPVLLGLASSGLALSPVQASDLCPASALSQVIRHQVRQGETLAAIAASYDLLPETLRRMNPSLGAAVSVGQAIMIPPFNGFPVATGAGQTWQTLAERYGVRADVLFEINGCQARVPNRIFIPGASQGGQLARSQPAQLTGYPLSTEAPVILSYGWQPHPVRDEMVFNSGIALGANPGTVVLAADAGTVAFVGAQEGYGNLVVINHRQGLQTRYGNLGEISVALGQPVRVGDSLGTVGGSERTAGSFLYFEVRINSQQGWVAQNPRQYIPALDLR